MIFEYLKKKNSSLHCDLLNLANMNVSILFRMKFPGGHATFMLMLQLGFRHNVMRCAHVVDIWQNGR